jgi:hypothetical protein
MKKMLMMMMMFFWVLMPCRLVGRYQHLEKHPVSIFRAEEQNKNVLFTDVCLSSQLSTKGTGCIKHTQPLPLPCYLFLPRIPHAIHDSSQPLPLPCCFCLQFQMLFMILPSHYHYPAICFCLEFPMLYMILPSHYPAMFLATFPMLFMILPSHYHYPATSFWQEFPMLYMILPSYYH